MTLLLTGSTGFIGSHVKALLAGREIVCPRTLGEAFPNPHGQNHYGQCIHLAWSGIPDFSEGVLRANVDMSREFLEHLADEGCGRVVVAGSCFEYGEAQHCVTEDMPSINPGPLGLAKLEIYATLQRIGIPHRWARIFYAYGPGQRESALIPSVIRAYEEGREPEIKTPNMVCDFIRVEDVARGLVSLLDADCPTGVYNLGSGIGRGVSGVVNTIAKRYGKTFPETPAHDGMWANMQKTALYTGFGGCRPFDV